MRRHRQKALPVRQSTLEELKEAKRIRTEDYQDHVLWPYFVRWVKTAGIVRKDLLEGHSDHWLIVWETFASGAFIYKTKVGKSNG